MSPDEDTGIILLRGGREISGGPHTEGSRDGQYVTWSLPLVGVTPLFSLHPLSVAPGLPTIATGMAKRSTGMELCQ